MAKIIIIKKTIPRNTRKAKRRPDAYCTNTVLHNNRPYPLYHPRVYYWNHKPMCRRCYDHYCANVYVDGHYERYGRRYGR